MSSRDGINEEAGTVDVYELCPEVGDSVMIVNCGTHYEIRHQSFDGQPPLHLTDTDMERLAKGVIVWN
jgi:hypothetical protein